MKSEKPEMNWREKLILKLSELLKVDLPKQYIDPVDKIFELEDNKLKAYVWKLKEGVKPSEINWIMNELHSRFIKSNKRDPNSLHILTRDVEEVRELSARELESEVFPWVDRAKSLEKNQRVIEE